MNQPNVEPAKKTKKPSSEWKKTPRNGAIKEKQPDFIGKAELARHLQCHINTVNGWIEDGTIPPPHSRLGSKHPVWLRRHYEAFRENRKWPSESFYKYSD